MISLGLLGYPLTYSLSPRLHGAALWETGLPGEYLLYPVPPLPEGEPKIAALLERMRAGAVRGLNVTIPHKQSVIPHLDELTPLAHSIGAVNTIYVKDGRLVGDNTDAPGFLSDLQRVFPGFSAASAKVALDGVPGTLAGPPRALVLGAGGAARAVVFVLVLAGWQVTLAARRVAQAEALAGDLERETCGPQAGKGGPWQAKGRPSQANVDAIPLSMAGLLSEGVQLIVNTTPVGMIPDSESSPWPAGAGFPAGAFVYDLVYKPPETALLRQARQAGLAAANGLGMLVEQACLALELWTGTLVPRRAMWQVLPEYLDSSQAAYLAGLTS